VLVAAISRHCLVDSRGSSWLRHSRDTDVAYSGHTERYCTPTPTTVQAIIRKIYGTALHPITATFSLSTMYGVQLNGAGILMDDLIAFKTRT